ncbi:MAG: HAD family hydrolase [Dehalococcoidia bacterium]|nr:HAD family hydrolase [Dehalococcoidia bacterium]
MALHVPVPAVIFDLDGLRLDTEPLYLAATQQLIDRYGRILDRALWMSYIGRPSPVVTQMIVEHHGLPVSAAEFHAEREHLLSTMLGNAEPIPGAVALVEHLSRTGVPISIATSSSREGYELKARRHAEWLAHFHCVITRSDVKNGKPAPDLFLRASEGMGVVPGLCLAFEDAPSGVEAVVAAGLRVIAVPTAGTDAASFTNATAVLGSLTEFDPGDWGLPG